MPASKKKKGWEITDSPQALMSEDVVGEEDVSAEVEIRSNLRFDKLDHVDEVITYVTEDKIQDMFANLQAGLLLTLCNELDKQDRK